MEDTLPLAERPPPMPGGHTVDHLIQNTTTSRKQSNSSSSVLTAHCFPDPESPNGVPFCVDTGADSSCISPLYLNTHFPGTTVIPDETPLRGFTQDGVHSQGRVNLTIPLRDTKGQQFTNSASLLIVNGL